MAKTQESPKVSDPPATPIPVADAPVANPGDDVNPTDLVAVARRGLVYAQQRLADAQANGGDIQFLTEEVANRQRQLDRALKDNG